MRIPTPLLCKKYKKVYSYRGSPSRDDDKYLQQIASQEPQSLSSIPSLRRFEQTSYKQGTFNRAFYMWNQWNYKDESFQGATKHKIRDQISVLKEEFRI
jgi:hypothetical protein